MTILDGGRAEIQGSYDQLFAAVPDALGGLLDSGNVGASAAVFVDGEPVVDVWGGFADAAWSLTAWSSGLSSSGLSRRNPVNTPASVRGRRRRPLDAGGD